MNAIKKIEGFEKFGSVLGLERIGKLMELLGNPERELKIIHVAGTNGKGSVCRYLYEGLRENGYKVGLFTSPFLQVFNERIEFDGATIKDSELESMTDLVLAKSEEMVSQGFDSPTEFEVITAIAFLHFHQSKADFVVLEVGLGGSGDSTNIIEKPLISIITSISYDHMDRLGGSLPEIAREKAGIIKRGVPVVCHVKDPGAARVMAKRAYEMDAVLYDAVKVPTRVQTSDMEGSTFDMNVYGLDYSELEISMAGDHQVENAKVALIALELLRKMNVIKVERSKLYQGIKKAKQIGRFEIMGKNPWVIIDGAHNKAGAEALTKVLQENLPDKKLIFVVGILEDKDAEAIIHEFSKVCREFIVTEPNSSRRMTADALCDIINKEGCICKKITEIPQACSAAMDAGKEFDGIVFAGSLYLIGEVRRILTDEWKQ